MDDEQKIIEAYKLLKSVKDKVVLLFSVAWNRVNNITAMERNIVEKMLKEYDYESVREGFMESVAQQKMNLAYVRAVAKSSYEKKSVKQNIKQHEEIKKEDSNQYWRPDQDDEWAKAMNQLGKKVQI